MTLPLRISEEAEAEMAEAARWYEAHRPRLGMEFLEAVDEAVARISDEDLQAAVDQMTRLAFATIARDR